MIQFRDFVPRMLSAPAFFKVGEYETGSGVRVQLQT